MNPEERDRLRDLAHRLVNAESAVAFTGAGISTESGIADFRSPGGIWSKRKPVYYQEFVASHEARQTYWAFKREVWKDMSRAKPNVAHRFLSRLEREGHLRAVITQNIDGLHQEAESHEVLELHGTNREAACIECGWRCPIDDAHTQMTERDRDVPICPECDGWLKPATISFGQSLPSDILARAEELSLASDLFFAIGSSLVVHPAAGLPRLAAERNAYLVIINREATPLDSLAAAIFRSPIGEVFGELERLYDTFREGVAESS